MIQNLKPYSAMKDSGVEWLGDVPEHWKVERLKSVMKNVIQLTGELQDGDLYVALEHVESWTGRLRHDGSEVSFDSQVKRFQSGDVLFGKLRPYLAKVIRPMNDGVCVGEFFVLRPRGSDITAHYMEQLMRSKPIIDEINSSTYGAKMPRADWQFVGGMMVPIPPLPEQTAIVRFLDYADNRIRRSIHAKQKLITLLEEEKQAIIHHAVTRGLDPDVPLKPSGVEWLGNVPEHWDILSMGVVTESIQTGPFGSQIHASEYVTGGIPVINPSHMCDGCIKPNPSVTVSQNKAQELNRHELRVGDIIIARRGELGRCALVKKTEAGWLCGTGSLRIRPKKEVFKPEYLCNVFGSQGICDTLSLSSIGSTMDNLNASMVAGLRLPCPPISEQRLILDFVTSSSNNIQFSADITRREITLLREYRTRLIADVVTGKLDVREAAANLPDESGEPGPFDVPDDLGDPDLLTKGEAELEFGLVSEEMDFDSDYDSDSKAEEGEA